ncbi:MAG: RNA polymerase sigma factor [Flavisolibacter sp.]
MSDNEIIFQQIDHLFRYESGKMISVLSRLLGLSNIETAQDIVQDTLLQAMNSWSFGGIPDNPSAWLYRVARNKAIDYLRREKRFRELTPQYQYQQTIENVNGLIELFDDNEIEDSQLRMIFACCHPAIPVESQIALALKTLCGLSVYEIARAFLTNDETISKRIYRAKEKIVAEQIQLELPSAEHLPMRMDAVLRSLYLLFSEGYNSSHTDHLIREELCEEAIRLTYLLTSHPKTNTSTAKALIALFCFQASRLRTRLDQDGEIILLKDQNRSNWFKPLMEKGYYYLESALENGETSIYHLQAGIASVHASAPSFDKTEWPTIYHLYTVLYELQPDPVIALNKAIAAEYAVSRSQALKELKLITELENYYLYHTTLGEIYSQVGEKDIAKAHLEKALKLTKSKKEHDLLLRKMGSIDV